MLKLNLQTVIHGQQVAKPSMHVTIAQSASLKRKTLNQHAFLDSHRSDGGSALNSQRVLKPHNVTTTSESNSFILQKPEESVGSSNEMDGPLPIVAAQPILDGEAYKHLPLLSKRMRQFV